MGFGRNLRGTGLAEFAAMADGPGNKGVLFLAAVVTLAALSVAARLNRMSPREIVAPEAWAALDRRESDRAAELFEQALRQRPRDAVLHFGLGSAEYGRGRTASSLASLQRAVEIDPRFDDALVLLGKVAYERGETEVAIRIDAAGVRAPPARRSCDRAVGAMAA